MIDEEILNVMKIELKINDKFMKLINRINKLPDAQRKKLESLNLIGPKDSKAMTDLIRKHKEIKKKFKEIEKQKSVYDGLSEKEIKERMAF